MLFNTKEIKMEDVEFAKWVLADTAEHVVHALAIYAAALGGYWALVG